MRCISAYLWELREVHRKIQRQPLYEIEEDEISTRLLRNPLWREVSAS